MPDHFGVTRTFGLTTPTVGYTNESSEESSVGEAIVEDEMGEVVKATAKNLIEADIVIKGKGDPEFANVVVGVFTVDVVKIVEATGDETNDEYPDFEIKGKKFSNVA